MPNSWIADLARPLAVVCHDAGAANIIFAGIRDAEGDIRVLARGPALTLARASLPPDWLVDDMEEALKGALTLLSGTGWASDIEHEARRHARRRGMRSIAVIDHWVNYRERFTRQGEEVLPDEIRVTDPEALALARPLFPGTPVTLHPNLYLAAAVAKIPPPPASPPTLLYVLEPARSTWGRDQQGEFQALDFFLECLPALTLPQDLQIVLRPHPSDAVGKYDAWLAAHPDLDARLDTGPDIAGTMAQARWVAGCESFALVLALAAGRQVLCTLPPWAPACRLPHDGIRHLKRKDPAP
ncbi:MAG: hypothetical protein ABS76_26885 [Pelagibacterium sp. SCN 64-44]|nr:MAG: hypothetical protein ABS76_26885 [Pelagibacterium sp. SCN 64-44]